MNRLKGLVLGVALTSLPAIAQAQTLTFEGLTNYQQIPDLYGGFTWSTYFWAFAPAPRYSGTGFNYGLKSGTMVAFSAFGFNGDVTTVGSALGADVPVSFSSASPFTFNSIWITPAWTTGETITIRGYDSNGDIVHTYIYDGTNPPDVPSDWQTPYFFAPNWSNLTKVDFYGSGGQNNGEGGEHLVFDDLTTSPYSPAVIPEPATLLLLGTGLAGIGVVIRRRRQKNIEG